MQSAELMDQLVTRSKKEMIGIRKDDPGAQIVREIALAESFHCGLRPDRHEDGSFDIPVGRVEDARAGAGVGTFGDELEGNLAQASIVAGSG